MEGDGEADFQYQVCGTCLPVGGGSSWGSSHTEFSLRPSRLRPRPPLPRVGDAAGAVLTDSPDLAGKSRLICAGYRPSIQWGVCAGNLSAAWGPGSPGFPARCHVPRLQDSRASWCCAWRS